MNKRSGIARNLKRFMLPVAIILKEPSYDIDRNFYLCSDESPPKVDSKKEIWEFGR